MFGEKPYMVLVLMVTGAGRSLWDRPRGDVHQGRDS